MDHNNPGRRTSPFLLRRAEDLTMWPQTWHKTWKRVTKPNVGNKQQVTQMYTSHATQLVIQAEIVLPLAPATYGISSSYSTEKHGTCTRCRLSIYYSQLHHAASIQVNFSHCQLHRSLRYLLSREGSEHRSLLSSPQFPSLNYRHDGHKGINTGPHQVSQSCV